MGPPLGRRDFLLGRASGPGAPVARMDERCLELRGIVCQACREACDQGAIRFLPIFAGMAKPLVDPSRCSGCGECVPACPGSAITIDLAR